MIITRRINRFVKLSFSPKSFFLFVRTRTQVPFPKWQIIGLMIGKKSCEIHNWLHIYLKNHFYLQDLRCHTNYFMERFSPILILIDICLFLLFRQIHMLQGKEFLKIKRLHSHPRETWQHWPCTRLQQVRWCQGWSKKRKIKRLMWKYVSRSPQKILHKIL